MTAHGSNAPRAWQRMLSGRRLDLLSPSPEDIEIDDIAHGLARVARWNGQTKGDHAFSVAQHSIVVTEIFEAIEPGYGRGARLAALLHDAPEYVIGDLISPFKAAIGLDYKAFEHRLLSAIHRRYGIGELDASVVQAIKRADTAAAYYEATQLAGFAPSEAQLFFGNPDLPLPLRRKLEALTPSAPNEAQASFLDKFESLSAS